MAAQLLHQSQLEFTGERMVPEGAGLETFWEHIYRYRFARDFVRGRTVLDIACGEGYGSSGLQKWGALNVVGVDISVEACQHARTKYNIDARHGSATAIPLATGSVDTVVSFETIEHVTDQQRFIEECFRVLKPGGILVISTPNRDVYSEGGGNNPFHCAELNEREFITLLRRKFALSRLYAQQPRMAACWSLRSLSASRSPWKKLPGYWWLRDKMLRFSLYGSRSGDARSAADKMICEHEPILGRLFNPYAVRRRSHITFETPTYFLAVCRRP